MLLVFLSLTMAGCEVTKEQQKVQLEQQVIMIATHDGITIYKVRDTTPGGGGWIYFSSTGDIQVQ
jgi:hypothetical protein